MKFIIQSLATVLLLSMSASAFAVNKCTAADGKIVFQDAPCAAGSVAARDDLADAKKQTPKNQDLQSAKAVAAALQSQLDTKLQNRPALRASSGATEPGVSSTSSEMSFDQCNATVNSTVRSLGVNWKDVKRIVNSSTVTMTKICTTDSSVTITCSKPDWAMTTTKGGQC